MRALLDNAGRIRLPDLVQAQLGVKPGDELAFEEELGRWFIKPSTSPDPPHELATPRDDSSDDLGCEELDQADLIVLSQVRPFPTGARRGPKP